MILNKTGRNKVVPFGFSFYNICSISLKIIHLTIYFDAIDEIIILIHNVGTLLED